MRLPRLSPKRGLSPIGRFFLLPVSMDWSMCLFFYGKGVFKIHDSVVGIGVVPVLSGSGVISFSPGWNPQIFGCWPPGVWRAVEGALGWCWRFIGLSRFTGHWLGRPRWPPILPDSHLRHLVLAGAYQAFPVAFSGTFFARPCPRAFPLHPLCIILGQRNLGFPGAFFSGSAIVITIFIV